ncbi:MAG: hypothetical protein JSR21_09030 [Proteobacteria bacterium]|nr:hypothetical protein [Pseudomonadota bacterium]
MKRLALLAAGLSGACLLAPVAAHAHGYAGPHMFVSTLIIDDPNVADEASLPTFSWQPQPTDGGPQMNLYAAEFELDKRITENFGFAVGGGYQWLTQPGNKTANGWENFYTTLKYKPYVNAEHEFMLSVGATVNFGNSGANGSNGATLDNDATDSFGPVLYFGKGFGDMPIGWARAFAITGQLGYQIAGTKLKVTGTDPDSGDPLFNNGTSNQWYGGLSLQYSIRYLSSQVKDYGLPEWVNRLTPLVELGWSSPASKPNQDSTQFIIAPGINYTADSYAFTVEALIPGNKQTGSHVGVIAQFHMYFDDMFPSSLGKPIVDWFK